MCRFFLWTAYSISLFILRFVKSHCGARETITTSCRMHYAPRSRSPPLEREDTWGGMPLTYHPTRGLGSVVGSPRRKWILCIFEVRKKPPGTPFSVFLSDCAPPPKCRGARENCPLSTGLFIHLALSCKCVH